MWLYLLLIPIESDVNYIKLFYIFGFDANCMQNIRIRKN